MDSAAQRANSVGLKLQKSTQIRLNLIPPEVAATLAILLPALLVNAGPVLLADGVAGGGAEGGAQVAAGGEESSQVAQADRLLTALTLTCGGRNTGKNGKLWH